MNLRQSIIIGFIAIVGGSSLTITGLYFSSELDAQEQQRKELFREQMLQDFNCYPDFHGNCFDVDTGVRGFLVDVSELKPEVEQNSTITEVKYDIQWDSPSKSYQLKINETEIPDFLNLIHNDNIICWQGIPYRSYFGSIEMGDDIPELNGWQVMVINNTNCVGDNRN